MRLRRGGSRERLLDDSLEMTDFVILWVDGSDEEWLKEKQQYDPAIVDASSCAARYRDWDNLQYWFRGVEKFAPWVNNIYFVTWGHTPRWLNTNHPKIRILKHSDFIPDEFLPTYNSNTIELNLHRIQDLSEQFVLFNDDTFIIDAVNESDFFKNGKPCDSFVMDIIRPHYDKPIIDHTSVNNVSLINKYFVKKKVIKNQFFKIFNYRYGRGIINNLMLSLWPSFTAFYNAHLPLSHLKSTFATLWDIEENLLHDTCINKFRQYNDLNHWLMRYWNLCNGDFIPRQFKFGKMFTASDDNTNVIDYITLQKGKMVCINDYVVDFDFDKAVLEIKNAFESILQEKSSYEK